MAVKTGRPPWAYRKGGGLLYRLPAGIKLIGLVGLQAGVFVSQRIFIQDVSFQGIVPAGLALPAGLVLPAAAFVIIALATNANIRPRELLQGGKVLFVLCAAIVILKTVVFHPPGINVSGFMEGVILCMAMVISFSSGALFFSTTTTGEIHRSLSGAESFLHLEKMKISLGLSLMLGFIPFFFEIWTNAESAWYNRRGKNNPAKLVSLIPLVIDKLLEKAARTAEALESRKF
ncbi:MAG: energy-coupling factor transporter transmembrane protein EcfT [Treponema sp.]|nr:energy-coupling factor transporter transmembrane protein EcfT [Treponema sp.]